MKIKRIGVALAAGAAATVLTLTGCTSTTSSPEETTSKSGGTITVAQVNEVTSFNYNTEANNLDVNGMVNYMTQPQFLTLDQKYNVVPNTDLGTYKKTSDDPLTVKYTLKKGVKWSDGKPMTADDLLLGWAQSSCYYNDATFDPNTGEVTKGNAYFANAGGCPWAATSVPKVGDDNRSIEWTYKDPYVDWQLVSPIQFPAHVVAEETGMTEDDLTKLLLNTPQGNPASPVAPVAALKKVSDFISTGYDATSLPTDKKLLVSGGPLEVSAWTPKQSMTFVPNPEYKGKHAVKFDKLVIRFIGDANAQVTALQNGEVDAIQPQASADTNKAIAAVSGAKALTGAQVAYDHLDLNFKSGVFKDENVRKAFLLTIPRDKIVDSITKPIDPKSKPLDSQIFLPGQEGYDESVKNNGSSDYDKVDIAKAKQLLGGKTPTVKILYNTGNPNRVDEFQAIQASAAQAGFKVTDGGSPDWSSLLAGGDYDASIFGWVSPGAGNAVLPQLFNINGGGNYNGYADPEADKLATKSQSTTDAKDLLKIKEQIDALTFKDAYGLPLFVSPGVFAYAGKVKGIEYFGGQTGIVWNFWDWTK